MRYSEQGLLEVLKKILRENGGPMDCRELFDMSEVREHAATVNRVSDYLGNLWRKGLLTRLPASGTGRGARWAYQWKTSAALNLGEDYTPKVLLDRPQVVITEEGLTMNIITPHLTITIKQTKS